MVGEMIGRMGQFCYDVPPPTIIYSDLFEGPFDELFQMPWSLKLIDHLNDDSPVQITLKVRTYKYTSQNPL